MVIGPTFSYPPNTQFTWLDDGDTNETKAIQAPGNYGLQIAKGGCSWSVNYQVLPPVTRKVPRTVFLCSRGVAILNATNPGATYLWSTGDTASQIQVSASGRYWVRTSRGCVRTDTVNVVVYDIIRPPDTLRCYTPGMTLDPGNAGSQFRWLHNNDTNRVQTLTAPGNYTVDIVRRPCFERVTYRVWAPVEANQVNDTTICNANSATLQARDSSATYRWSTGDSTRSVTLTQTGTYWVQVGRGYCPPVRDTFRLTLAPALAPPVDTLFCLDTLSGTLLRGPAGGTTYNWSTGATTPNVRVTQPGRYILTVRRGDCIDRYSYFVSPVPVAPSPTTFIASGDTTLLLDAGNPGALRIWSTSDTTQLLAVQTSGEYWVETGYGLCYRVDTFRVTILPDTGDTTPPVLSGLEIPSAFSPNGDGLNDEYRILAPTLLEFRVQIFNRRGELLFTATEPTFRWNGEYLGQPCPEGVYFYVMRFRTAASTFTRRGTITLLR
jgi:gliding motility-associated-like protein